MRESGKLSSLGDENTIEFQSLVKKTTANPSLFQMGQDIQTQIRAMETLLGWTTGRRSCRVFLLLTCGSRRQRSRPLEFCLLKVLRTWKLLLA